MSRLVKDGKIYLDGTLPCYEKERIAFNKLEQIEDIEEELGIDLVTLFKALKQDTLFVKTAIDIKETIKNGEGWAMKSLMLEDGKLIIFTDILYPNEFTKKEWLTPMRLQLSDYGKTWALTKEELCENTTSK